MEGRGTCFDGAYDGFCMAALLRSTPRGWRSRSQSADFSLFFSLVSPPSTANFDPGETQIYRSNDLHELASESKISNSLGCQVEPSTDVLLDPNFVWRDGKCQIYGPVSSLRSETFHPLDVLLSCVRFEKRTNDYDLKNEEGPTGEQNNRRVEEGAHFIFERCYV